MAEAPRHGVEGADAWRTTRQHVADRLAVMPGGEELSGADHCAHPGAQRARCLLASWQPQITSAAGVAANVWASGAAHDSDVSKGRMVLVDSDVAPSRDADQQVHHGNFVATGVVEKPYGGAAPTV